MTTDTRIEIANPQAYKRKLNDLLADRDPWEVMSSTPDVVQRIFDAHTESQLRARPFAGKWTPTEVIGHLFDVEWVFGYRTRTILYDDRPAIIGMDQDLWVAGQRHADGDPYHLLGGFRSLRECNLNLWRTLTESDMERVGVHNERGEESIRDIFRIIPGHDLSHIDQITRYLRAVTGD